MHESNVKAYFYFIFLRTKYLLLQFYFIRTMNIQIIMGGYEVTMRRGTNVD